MEKKEIEKYLKSNYPELFSKIFLKEKIEFDGGDRFYFSDMGIGFFYKVKKDFCTDDIMNDINSIDDLIELKNKNTVGYY